MKIDTTKPHIGRIYDFVLGGHHNYEVDRQYAEKMLAVVPSYPKLARLNRWFLQLVAKRWADQGVERVLDLGSGLPTQGHLNEYLSDARILFSDNDPLSVSYGSDILSDNYKMKYIMGDVRDPEPLLEEATRFFGDERRVAIGLVGLSYLLPDEVVTNLAQRLHAWCAPGSVMALSYAMPYEGGGPSEALPTIKQMTGKLGVEIQIRSTERLAELIAPWRIVESDALEKLLDMEGTIDEQEKASSGMIAAGATAVR
jgi:O-methyltransferase involved in polyketide biosynthesis